MSSSSSNTKRTTPIPKLELLVGMFGLLLVLAAVGVLIFEATQGDQSPPDIELTVSGIFAGKNQFLVKVTAENQGGLPAARVMVHAELVENGQVIEDSETELDYLPPHSTREAGVFFSRDPRQGEVRLIAKGFDEL